MKDLKQKSMVDEVIEKTIVVSAINFFEGGPLSILMDTIDELSSRKYERYKVIFFIHKKSLIFQKQFPSNINFIELPKSRNSYLLRLYYEYFYFYQFSKKINVFFWLSLHDITPNVLAKRRGVYCHNPTPFYKNKTKDFFMYPSLYLSSIFYKYIYRINIHKNDFVIVQPYWIKKEFIRLFDIKAEKIVVASPISNENELLLIKSKDNTGDGIISFCYPCISRPFKNIEVIAEACRILSQRDIHNYQLLLTIDGTENKYSKKILERFREIKEIQFLGKQTRDSVNRIYEISDILLFPSTLETWGLPLTEFKVFKKPMLVANLNYAKETVGIYEKVDFLDPENPEVWANKMQQIILGVPFTFEGNDSIEIPNPKANNWASIFDLLFS